MNYVLVQFTNLDSPTSEILVALLSEIQFEFEEIETGLKAFIPEEDFNEALLKEVIQPLSADLHFTISSIKNENWNQIWESGYHPVFIGEDVVIRAPFHTNPPHKKYDLVITPKMSFGTGHHATTSLMIETMLKLHFRNKKVLDFGSGTGILAIMAAKLGAVEIEAIDNDVNSVENSIENIRVNNVNGIISVRTNEEEIFSKQYGMILANINRNIILQYLEKLSKSLLVGGEILFSGILREDEKVIIERAAAYSLVKENVFEMDGWLVIPMVKKI